MKREFLINTGESWEIALMPELIEGTDGQLFTHAMETCDDDGVKGDTLVYRISRATDGVSINPNKHQYSNRRLADAAGYSFWTALSSIERDEFLQASDGVSISPSIKRWALTYLVEMCDVKMSPA